MYIEKLTAQEKEYWRQILQSYLEHATHNEVFEEMNDLRNAECFAAQNRNLRICLSSALQDTGRILTPEEAARVGLIELISPELLEEMMKGGPRWKKYDIDKIVRYLYERRRPTCL